VRGAGSCGLLRMFRAWLCVSVILVWCGGPLAAATSLGNPNDSNRRNRPISSQQLPSVVIGTPHVLAEGPGVNAASPITCLASGEVVAAVDHPATGGKTAESYVMISSDVGKTWRKQAMPWNGAVKMQLRDGAIFVTTGWAQSPAQEQGVCTYPVLRGKDTWESLRPETITVRSPAIVQLGDNLKPIQGLILWNRVVEMPSGDLLLTAYGNFKGDDVPLEVSYEALRPTLYPYPGMTKTRAVLLKSADQGHTWDYVTTISDDPSSGDEGPCEPSLTRTNDGDLVCVMRTGRVNALRLSRSSDGGKTWTPLKVIPRAIGVAPFLITMRDGTLACAYGMKEDYWKGEHRRELHIMFSFDQGRTWPLNEIVYAGEASSYPSICEARPGELLLAFDPVDLRYSGAPLMSFAAITRVRLKPAPVYRWP